MLFKEAFDVLKEAAESANKKWMEDNDSKVRWLFQMFYNLGYNHCVEEVEEGYEVSKKDV